MQRLVAALVCVGASLGAASGALAVDKPATHTVVIEAMKFQPETLTVRRGDTVVWINKDPFPHTATAPGGFERKFQ